MWWDARLVYVGVVVCKKGSVNPGALAHRPLPSALNTKLATSALEGLPGVARDAPYAPLEQQCFTPGYAAGLFVTTPTCYFRLLSTMWQ